MDVLVVDPAKVQQFVGELINGAPPAPSPSGSSSTSTATPTSPSTSASTSTAPIDAGCIH